jgi:hypothetical protein
LSEKTTDPRGVKQITLTFGNGVKVTVVPFDDPTEDDQELAEALAVARKAGVIIVTKKDRDNPIYLDKRSRRPIGGIELNLRLRKVLK